MGHQPHSRYSLVVDRGRESSRWNGQSEVGRADGIKGVRVQGENVLVVPGVMYDMLREV